MLYYFPRHGIVALKAHDTEDYETFTPTIDGWSKGYIGFIVVTVCSQYDSIGPYDSECIEVVDMYPTRGQAREVCKAIKESAWKGELKAAKADGSKIYTHWQHWGSSLERVELVEVEIKDELELKKEIY